MQMKTCLAGRGMAVGLQAVDQALWIKQLGCQPGVSDNCLFTKEVVTLITGGFGCETDQRGKACAHLDKPWDAMGISPNIDCSVAAPVLRTVAA